MKTLLYVDDDPNDRLLVESACRRASVSFRLKTSESGVEAIRYLSGEGEFDNRAEHPLPDLILLDLKMPEMDGFEVLRWIRANPATRTIPVALYSGSSLSEDIAKGYSQGANYFISKPPQLATLIDFARAVDECLAAEPDNREALARFSATGKPR
jgi:CheY-like chemotaxis protein